MCRNNKVIRYVCIDQYVIFHYFCNINVKESTFAFKLAEKGFFFLFVDFCLSSTGLKVYSREIRDVEDLRTSIAAAIATVTKEMLQRTWLELDYQLDILRATKGAHVEVH
ncbi:hypothetical protein AVEN_248594-1 [Araneus ventricosus]|uniref:Uncharacterized protein n=1 Tax=Araneus ventricosus TaxID=182803 RepID=A0A4Y2I1K0_ARAVE|nr:hypothetical protein AVEN_248594-1 [Araneus ventricosus]